MRPVKSRPLPRSRRKERPMETNTIKLGKVTLEKVRQRRDYSDRKLATLTCDAASVTDNRRVLLLSVVGSESVLKALRGVMGNADLPIEIGISIEGVPDENG